MKENSETKPQSRKIQLSKLC